MKYTVKYVYIIASIIFIGYLSIKSPNFPKPPENTIQSFEPADVETPLRRGYYTNLTRREVMDHYMINTGGISIAGIKFPKYRLNYPPEEAQILIRDQARSTFLEEIVHPFRESFFINGYEPVEDKDLIEIDGRRWRQKIIVRYVPSNMLNRTLVGMLIVIITPILLIKLIYVGNVFLKLRKN